MELDAILCTVRGNAALGGMLWGGRALKTEHKGKWGMSGPCRVDVDVVLSSAEESLNRRLHIILLEFTHIYTHIISIDIYIYICATYIYIWIYIHIYVCRCTYSLWRKDSSCVELHSYSFTRGLVQPRGLGKYVNNGDIRDNFTV